MHFKAVFLYVLWATDSGPIADIRIEIFIWKAKDVGSSCVILLYFLL